METIKDTIEGLIEQEEIEALFLPKNLNPILPPGLHTDPNNIDNLINKMIDLLLNQYSFYIWTKSWILYKTIPMPECDHITKIPRNPSDSWDDGMWVFNYEHDEVP